MPKRLQENASLWIAISLLLAVFLPRLISLGTTLTIDEPLWVSRGQTFMNGFATGRFDKTLVAGQPGVTTAWLVGLTIPSESLALKQAAISMATGIIVLICTYFLTLLLGKKWGLVAGFMLALDPFLLGHSRVVHTDALQALLYLASLLALLTSFVPWQKGERVHIRYIVASAALGALAILTKLFAIIIIPTAIAIIVALSLVHKQKIPTIIRLLGIWITACALTAYIAWPALWFNADQVIDHLAGRATIHAEGTRSEETTSLKWYYAREALFRLATPTAILLPLGLWYTVRHKRKTMPISILCAAGIIYAIALSTSSDKSDRYILFTLLTFIPVATLGIQHIEKIWQQRGLAMPILVWIIPIAWLVIDAARIHPHYLAHFNRLYPIESTHKLGWGEGLEEVATWLKANDPDAKVLSYYPRVLDHFYEGEVESITHINETNADYVVLYRSMFERGTNSAEEDIIRNYLQSDTHTLVHVVTINSLPYAWIFKP